MPEAGQHVKSFGTLAYAERVWSQQRKIAIIVPVSLVQTLQVRYARDETAGVLWEYRQKSLSLVHVRKPWWCKSPDLGARASGPLWRRAAGPHTQTIPRGSWRDAVGVV